MAQGTSSEINSKLVEYFIEMLFDENAAIDRIQPRIEEESPTFHVRVESNYDLWSIAIRGPPFPEELFRLVRGEYDIAVGAV